MILFMYYIYYVHVQVLFICSNIESLIEKKFGCLNLELFSLKILKYLLLPNKVIK